MANPTGKKDAHWSPEHVATMVAMTAAGASIREISDAVGRTYYSVQAKNTQIRLATSCGVAAGQFMPRYDTPTPRANDDDAHVGNVAAANAGYGFPVVTSPTIDKINAFDAPPPAIREFWRAS